MDVLRRLGLVVALLGTGAGGCADPVETPDAGIDVGVPADAGQPPRDAGPVNDAGVARRQVTARGLAPVLGISSGARREVRGRVSPIVGDSAGPRRVVRTLPTPGAEAFGNGTGSMNVRFGVTQQVGTQTELFDLALVYTARR